MDPNATYSIETIQYAPRSARTAVFIPIHEKKKKREDVSLSIQQAVSNGNDGVLRF